jgi:hypothetical protein
MNIEKHERQQITQDNISQKNHKEFIIALPTALI